MPRRLRFHQPFTTYHVMLRGNDKQPIFFSEDDRCHMCHLIQDGVERFGHAVQSFCFMINHIHLAIQVREIPVSHIIQNLAFRYTQYVNNKYDRIGHLFQGRFKSVVVDEESYLLELIRYIHLNPVRAKLVQRPEEYAWSSHNAYLLRNEITWLSFQSVLQRFGDSSDKALENYLNFIYRGIDLVLCLKSFASYFQFKAPRLNDPKFARISLYERIFDRSTPGAFNLKIAVKTFETEY